MTTTTPSPADTLNELIRRGDELIPRHNEAILRWTELDEQRDRLDLAEREEYWEARLAAARAVDGSNVELVRLYADQLAFLQSLDPAAIRFLETS